MTQHINAVQLYDFAHARAGDKGNHSSICVFSYQPEDFDVLVSQVTDKRVGELFAHRHPSSVKRYLLPTLHGINFVIEDVLDGGVNSSLNMDMHGKSLSFLLLSMEVHVPSRLANKIKAGGIYP